MMEKTRELTLEEIKGLDQKTLDFTPDDRKVESIGTLLLHIAGVELSWIMEDIKEMDIDYEPWRNAFALRPSIDEEQIHGMPVDYFIDRLEQVRGEVAQWFGSIEDDLLEKIINVEGRNCSVEWILFHVFEHELTHLGQIRLLKRLAKIASL